MKRNSILKILNPVLACLAAAQILSGLLHSLLPKELFLLIHPVGGLALGIIIAAHVAFNWNWVKANYFAGKPTAEH